MGDADVRASQETVDEDVMRRLRDGDESGLELLLEAHGGRVTWWLNREFGDVLGADGVDDALSQGLAKVWDRHETYDAARGPLRAWFYSVCRNEARMAVRKFHPTVDVELDHLAARGPVEKRSGPSPYVRALRGCIAALPRLQRRVIEADLQSPDGAAPAAELARAANSSASAVYNARSKARRSLKDCLESKGQLDRRAAGKETE